MQTPANGTAFGPVWSPSAPGFTGSGSPFVWSYSVTPVDSTCNASAIVKYDVNLQRFRAVMTASTGNITYSSCPNGFKVSLTVTRFDDSTQTSTCNIAAQVTQVCVEFQTSLFAQYDL